jgi:hypothetical protein
MPSREFLPNLDAASMPMHIAESADIHQDVKAKLLTRAKGSLHLIVTSAMPHTDIDNFVTNCFSGSLDSLANLAMGIMSVLINKSRR